MANDPDITGLTTAQFQSGLPAGFDPTVWREKSNINGGCADAALLRHLAGRFAAPGP